jgi:predicted negative regulator of RcsB-dependent stress response
MAEKKRTRKELLKSQDEFITLSTRVIRFVKEHSTHFTYLGVALAAIVLVYLGMNSYAKYKNRKGQEAYNIAYYALSKNMGRETDPERIAQSREQFQKVIEEYPKTKAGKLALPELAFLRFKEKNYDEAITLYEQFLKKVKDRPSYQSLARMALATCYEEKGESQKAIEILEKLHNNPDNFIAEQSMLSLARLYRDTNQYEQARKILKEFVEHYQESPFLPFAKAYLNRLS